MARPLVSIVTPCFNHVEYIERTLRSVLCQDYENVEYIVMDGGSTDGTREVLDTYAGYLDVLVSEPDAGQSDALNRGFRLARGDVLAYLNSDDCYASAQTISRAVHHFAASPSFDVIYGRRYTIDEEGKLLHFLPYRPFSEEMLYLVDYVPQESTFWTRRAYERAGGFVNADYDFAMDYELWLRMLRAGARFHSVPELFGLFRYYADQKTTARWQTQGLPEIARLYREYLGRIVPEREMHDYHDEHFYGAHARLHPKGAACFQRFWRPMLGWYAEHVRDFRFDGWVEDAEVNPARGQKAPGGPRARDRASRLAPARFPS